MKIDFYEVPVTLKRTPAGVEVTLHEDQKKFIRSEPVANEDATMIPNLAKEIGDHNDVQRTLISNTMLRSETESTGKITLKYLS